MPISSTSRRAFLKAVAGTGAGLLVARHGLAGRETDDRVCWALVADTHISANPDKVERGGKISERLRLVVRNVLGSRPRPVGMIINGDVAYQKGRREAYATLMRLIQPIRRAKIDLHVAPGNHDDRANLLAAIPSIRSPTTAPASSPSGPAATQPATPALPADKHVTVIDSGPVRLVLLDSLLRPDVIKGRLGNEQLSWLAETLDAEKNTPTILFLHHNLGPGAGLEDSDALLKVIRPRRQVKAVFQGHNHVYAFGADAGMHLVKQPAVGYAFGPEQPVGWIRAWFDAKGAELELRAVDGNRKLHATKKRLRWRE